MTQFPPSLRLWAVVACLAAGAADLALAQSTGRLAGSVKDLAGKAVKGAAIKARNPGGTPAEINVSSDARGNWAMLGLSTGVWDITASAPGFEGSTAAVRVSALRSNPNVNFVLAGITPKGALEGIDAAALQGDLATAEEFMAAGKPDEALAIYRALLARVPPLTTLGLAVGRALRMKKDFAGAIEAYGDLLKAEPANQTAMLELARTHQERGDRAAAVAALEALIALDGATDQARDAKALLAQLKQSA